MDLPYFPARTYRYGQMHTHDLFVKNSFQRMDGLPGMTSSQSNEMKSEYESTPSVTGSNSRTEILQGPDSSLHLEEIQDVSVSPVFEGLPYDTELSSSERIDDLPDYESSKALHPEPSVISISDDSDSKTLPIKGTPFPVTTTDLSDPRSERTKCCTKGASSSSRFTG